MSNVKNSNIRDLSYLPLGFFHGVLILYGVLTLHFYLLSVIFYTSILVHFSNCSSIFEIYIFFPPVYLILFPFDWLCAIFVLAKMFFFLLSLNFKEFYKCVN